MVPNETNPPREKARRAPAPTAQSSPARWSTGGGLYVWEWVATGAPQPCSLPLANDTGIAFLGDPGGPPCFYKGAERLSLLEEQGRCHRMMQHLQKRCLLPPTEGGGVTGAK